MGLANVGKGDPRPVAQLAPTTLFLPAVPRVFQVLAAIAIDRDVPVHRHVDQRLTGEKRHEVPYAGPEVDCARRRIATILGRVVDDQHGEASVP